MSAQEALDAARHAEAARKVADAEAAQKALLAQKLVEEARARVEAERARRAAEEEKRRAEAARRDAARREQEDREADEQMARDRALSRSPARSNTRTGPLEAPINEGRVHAILKRLADDIEILEVYGDIRPEVLGVLWQAHVKRARMERDLPTLALALALAARFEQKPKAMLAARVQWHGKDWAVWVDTERKEVLAALTPADRYLTGL